MLNLFLFFSSLYGIHLFTFMYSALLKLGRPTMRPSSSKSCYLWMLDCVYLYDSVVLHSLYMLSPISSFWFCSISNMCSWSLFFKVLVFQYAHNVLVPTIVIRDFEQNFFYPRQEATSPGDCRPFSIGLTTHCVFFF